MTLEFAGLSPPGSLPTPPRPSSQRLLQPGPLPHPSWTAAGATWEASGMADGYRSQDRASRCPRFITELEWIQRSGQEDAGLLLL